MKTLTSIFLAARPKTLAAGFVPVGAGCMIVGKYAEMFPTAGIELNWMLAFYTLASCLCLQIACNFFNDAIDAINEADTKKRQGPKRITASGLMSPLTVKLCGLGFLLAACALAMPLIMTRGWGIIAIGIPSMIFAYGYTGWPIRLAYRGLGELFVIIFFGLIAVMGTVFVQIGWQESNLFTMMYAAAFILGMQCGLLSCVMIEINNIRDRKEDATTGKRTLAVRLGDKRARGLAMAFIIAPYITLKQTASVLPMISFNLYWLAPIFLAIFIVLKLRKMPANKKMNMLLGLASLHLILYLSALSWA